jgi:hypothetical protein
MPVDDAAAHVAVILVGSGSDLAAITAERQGEELITIQQDDDWEQLRTELKIVVDPTIFRTAEVFLQGERAAHDKRTLWQAISANVGSQ